MEKRKKIRRGSDKKTNGYSRTQKSVLVGLVLMLFTLGFLIFSHQDLRSDVYYNLLFNETRNMLYPHFEKLNDEIINPVIETVNEKFDPYLNSLKIKVAQYKELITHIVPEENWFNKSVVFELRQIEKDIKPKHPVVVIPGCITSELEIWKGKDCVRFFKEKVWGGIDMISSFLTNKKCWLEHISLNRTTGLDPEGITVRPKKEAVDYLFPLFWVWGKVIEELGNSGYDPSNLIIEEYDWRLDFQNLEKRDRYFSRLKRNIEFVYESNNEEKVVALTHSMGGMVWYYFMNWVESKNGGARVYRKWYWPFSETTEKWCDKYIDSVVNIGAPLLGLTKSLSAVLSGEMKDTADFLYADDLIERIFSREERTKAFRSFGSMIELFPKGLDELWGPIFEFQQDEKTSHYEQQQQQEEEEEERFFLPGRRHLYVSEVLKFLKKNTDEYFSHRLEETFLGATGPRESFIDEPKYWTNPFASSLPYAPNMKIYSLYGINQPTEIGYKLMKNEDEETKDLISYRIDTKENKGEGLMGSLMGGGRGGITEPPNPLRHYHFYDQVKPGPIRIDNRGDGTVPHVSLYYPCGELWKQKKYNPSMMKTFVKEYDHRPVDNVLSKYFDFRGGGKSGNHVNIMGNHEILKDILYIVSGHSEKVQERKLL